MGFVTFSKALLVVWSRESVIGVVNRLRVGRPRNPGLIPNRDKRVFSSPERLGRFCGLAERPIQSVLGVLSPGLERPGREVDRHQILRLMSGAMTPHPHTPSWSAQDQL